MSCYGSLAQWYDAFTEDVPYDEFLSFYEAEFAGNDGEFRLILDLCCGTGSITAKMAAKGYEMIGVDASPDMLMEAREKTPETLFLCQDAVELDLFGTVDACICCLDSINYIDPKLFGEILRRLRLFIRPGGLFLFDIRPDEWLRAMDGSTSVDETDDALCLWRADFDEELGALIYGMDIFSRKGTLWERSCEEHIEYSYSMDLLKSALETGGFVLGNVEKKDERIFISCKRND